MPDSEAETDSPVERQPRQSRLVKAVLDCARLGQFDITIRNVSQNGIGGQGPHVLRAGERLTIHLPGHEPMTGIVRWARDGRFGIETDAAIDTGRLRGTGGEGLITSDSKADFQIVPAPKLTSRRPGLGVAYSPPGSGIHRR